ncbi:MAG: glycosyltransferase, partial [Turicibacter sp.]|nr:glycosyltransferase [Turicibacter sp.]
MNQPKVSIIIPVYNVEDYIGLTLDSLLNQTLKEIEIILIDDGSTDNSRQIIDDYSKKYENIKVILQENSGPSHARNRGIIEATGEFITFADSDDLLPEDSIEVRYNTAIEQDADIVIGATYKFNSKRKWPLKTHFLGNGEKKVQVNGEILWTVSPWNKIYKSEIIKELKFPESIKYAEDQVFVIEAYLRAKKIYSIDNVVYYYRMREDNSAESLTQKRYSESANVLRQICDVWLTTCGIIDKYIDNEFFADNIKRNYLNRLAEADIWPTLKSAIISKNKEVQKQALEYCIILVKSMSVNVLRGQSKFRWIMSKGLVDKYLFIHKSNRKLLLQLITALFNKMDSESLYEFKQEQKYFVDYMEKAVNSQSNIQIYAFLANRRFDRIRNSLKPANLKKSFNKRLVKFCSEDVFKISRCFPVKKDLLILATNRSAELEGNLKAINDELATKSNLRVIMYLKQDKVSNMNLIRMYYHFARAKYIIIDDYYRQLYGYKFNKETEIIQVWHACGAFKKFGFSAIGQGESNTLSFERRAH